MSAITWHCSQYKHAPLAQFKGTPVEERLALESHEFLHTIDSALENALKLTAPVHTVSLMDEMPMLALCFNQVYPRGDKPVTEADRPRMLEAFGRLVQFSAKLNACPPVKTAFWATVATALCGHDTKNLHRQLFGLPEFPQFVIDCSGRRYQPWSNLNEALCDAVYDFLTAASDETTSSTPVSLGLSFADEEPTLGRTREQLEMIERMLDRISTSPTPQYTLTVLNLNNTILNTPELEVVARIVVKCKSGFYQIEKVTIDSMIPNIGMQGYSPGETPREFLDITSAAFSPVELPRFWSFKPPADLPTRADNAPSVLRKVSLNKNVLTHGFYSEHFSTLRYGCPLDEDLTDYSISMRNHDRNSVDCWRWIAFGLFYPRPKRFADAYKLRTIGKLTLDPVAIKTIVNTVRNPAAQLVHNAGEDADTPIADCLMVCTVKEGAEIEVFVSGLQVETQHGYNGVPNDPWYKSLLETSEFEALCEREDGSVCVVVPGAGLGWVSKDDVVLLEREPLDIARSAHDGLYQLTIGSSQSKTHVGELQPLFNAIGRQVRSLTVDFNLEVTGIFGSYTFDYDTPIQETVMQFIRDHCVNLRHLNLNGATNDELAALLTALSSSDLGSRLLTLNLNEYRQPVDNDFALRLASVLANTEYPPALRELRMNQYGIKSDGLTSLHDALTVNENLTLLELRRMSSFPSDAGMLELQDRLDAAFQGVDVGNGTRRTIAWSEDFSRSF